MKADVITIRVATADDAAKVSAVLASSYAALYPDWYPTDVLAAALPTMTTARPELLTSGRYYLAEMITGPIACGGWSIERPGAAHGERGVAYVRHFATDPNYLRRGVAGAILEYSIRQARAAGSAEMECDSSLPAERFYAAYGFQRRGEHAVTVAGRKFPVIRMARPL